MDFQSFLLYLGDIFTPRFLTYWLIMVAASIFGIINWKELSKKYKFLTLLLVSVSVSEAISRILIQEIGNSHPTYHIIIPLQCIFYALIFGVLSKNRVRIGLVFGVAMLACLLNSFLNQSFFNFPTISLICLSFAIVINVLFDFERIRKHPTEFQLIKMGDFWMNIGTLLFFSITFFGFAMMSIEGKQFPKWVYHLIYGANIILYISYFVALYLERKPNDSNNN